MSGDQLDLDAIEAREQEATPGPWEADGYEGRVTGQTAVVVDGVEMWAEADAQFIAHAREDVPALVAEVRRLRAQVGPVVEAWRNPGPQPAYHRKAQARLRREWPSLAKAVERLARE